LRGKSKEEESKDGLKPMCSRVPLKSGKVVGSNPATPTKEKCQRELAFFVSKGAKASFQATFETKKARSTKAICIFQLSHPHHRITDRREVILLIASNLPLAFKHLFKRKKLDRRRRSAFFSCLPPTIQDHRPQGVDPATLNFKSITDSIGLFLFHSG